LEEPGFPPDVRALAADGTSLYAGTERAGVFVSPDNGTTWTAVNKGLTNLKVLSLAVKGTALLAGTQGSGVFVFTTMGTSSPLTE
jgi:hypothetical protein